MQTKTLAALLVLTIAPLANGLQTAAEWMKYTPEDSRFSALFPQQPKISSAPGTSESGDKLTKHIAQAVDASGSIYVLGFTDYPYPLDSQKSLDGARDKSIQAMKATLLRESNITLDGNAGREYMASIKGEGFDGLIQVRAYVVGTRLYMLMYGYQKSLDPETAAKNTARFFDSFKLTAGK